MADKDDQTAARTKDRDAKPPIGRWIGIGIGAGIGSAAIAAALLYANGTKSKPGGK